MKLLTIPRRAASSDKSRLGDLLLQSEELTREQLDIALQMQQKSGKKLGQVLIEAGVVRTQEIARAIATQLSIPFVDLKTQSPSPAALALVPEALAQKYVVLPLEIVGDCLVMVMANPEDIPAVDDLRAHTRMRIQPAFALESSVRESIEVHYKSGGKINEQVRRLDSFSRVDEAEDPQKDSGVAGEGAAVELVDLLLADAVRQRASDIHIDAQGQRVRVRYRIDGILHDV